MNDHDPHSFGVTPLAHSNGLHLGGVIPLDLTHSEGLHLGATIGGMGQGVKDSFSSFETLIEAAHIVAGLAGAIGALVQFKNHHDHPSRP
jgi:hypothetical protein